MKIQISKENNTFKKNYYRLEIITEEQLSQVDYKTIIDSIENIAEVLDPVIEKEIKLEQALKNNK
ncbi:MAG: hypothetical protein WCY09_09175 [Candidatus Omnitrophota bacterium]|jgi:hypothetical protein